MRKRILIGIVLYNPNILLLKNNLKVLEKITKKIIFVDNGSNNIEDIKKIVKSNQIVLNKTNKGIGKALNQLLEIAINNKYDLLLTLDQDSSMTLDSFIYLNRYISLENVAIACPTIHDLNKQSNKMPKKKYEFVTRCITSGSLMNIDICKQIGRFDEKMFIDYVDFDFCKQIILANYKIIKVKDAILNHQIGNRTTRRFFFWKVYPTNHDNLVRYYYFARNIKYYLNKYKGNLTIKEYIHDIIHLCWKFINVILYENNKKSKVQIMLKGLTDSKKM